MKAALYAIVVYLWLLFSIAAGYAARNWRVGILVAFILAVVILRFWDQNFNQGDD